MTLVKSVEWNSNFGPRYHRLKSGKPIVPNKSLVVQKKHPESISVRCKIIRHLRVQMVRSWVFANNVQNYWFLSK